MLGHFYLKQTPRNLCETGIHILYHANMKTALAERLQTFFRHLETVCHQNRASVRAGVQKKSAGCASHHWLCLSVKHAPHYSSRTKLIGRELIRFLTGARGEAATWTERFKYESLQTWNDNFKTLIVNRKEPEKIKEVLQACQKHSVEWQKWDRVEIVLLRAATLISGSVWSHILRNDYNSLTHSTTYSNNKKIMAPWWIQDPCMLHSIKEHVLHVPRRLWKVDSVISKVWSRLKEKPQEGIALEGSLEMRNI